MSAAWPVLGVAYLLGAIPFGYLVVRLRQGRDIRSAGSGNIGAANVARTAGPWAGLLTLLLDAAKGYLAAWLAARWSDDDIRWIIAAALAAMIGHLFPVFLKFRGGRGVATGAGAFLLICWPAILGALAVWALIVGLFRYASLGSIAAAAALPPLIYVLYAPPHAPPQMVSLGATLAAIMIILRHRPNIRRLIAGTEPKLKFGSGK